MNRRHVPVLVDLSGKSIVIFGGGEVAERKARFFSSGDVIVISREFSDAILRMASSGSLRLIEADLKTDEGMNIAEMALEGAFIAVPATSDGKLNALLEEMAHERGVLVNCVDREGEIILPSVVERDSVILAISSGIPALSRYMRIQLERDIERYASMAELLRVVRRDIKDIVKKQSRRRDILWSILSDDSVWKEISKGDISRAYEKAYMRVRENLTPDEQDNLDAGNPQEGLDR